MTTTDNNVPRLTKDVWEPLLLREVNNKSYDVIIFSAVLKVSRSRVAFLSD